MSDLTVFGSDSAAPCPYCQSPVAHYDTTIETGWVIATCVSCGRCRSFSLPEGLTTALREDTLTAAQLSAYDRDQDTRRRRRGATP